MTREELTDLIAEAISDSMDVDWGSNIGARYVVDALAKEGFTGTWQAIGSAPRDGTHILACQAGTTFGWFNGKQAPPFQTVVHWFDDPEEPGFYTSVNELEPQHPFQATHWKPLDAPPAA